MRSTTVNIPASLSVDYTQVTHVIFLHIYSMIFKYYFHTWRCLIFCFIEGKNLSGAYFFWKLLLFCFCLVVILLQFYLEMVGIKHCV